MKLYGKILTAFLLGISVCGCFPVPVPARAAERLPEDEGLKIVFWNLENIDLLGISGENRRKVRRIIEKRVCQDLYRMQRARTTDNFGRYNEKHRLSNTLKNIYGQFHYSSEFVA